MVFDHIGIVNTDAEAADRYYRGLLGFEKTRESSVPPELSRQLFSVDHEIRMLLYVKDNLKVEVFIIDGFVPPLPAVPHFCLQVPDLPELLERLRRGGVAVISAERGGRMIHFAEDFSGNRMEIKQQ